MSQSTPVDTWKLNILNLSIPLKMKYKHISECYKTPSCLLLKVCVQVFIPKQYRQYTEAIQLNQHHLCWTGIKTSTWSVITLHWKPMFYTSSHNQFLRTRPSLFSVSHFRGCLQRCVLLRIKATSAFPILGLTETTINSVICVTSISLIIIFWLQTDKN